MRLIDADVLQRKFEGLKEKDSHATGRNAYDLCAMLTEDAPTVEAVVLKFKIGDTAFFLNRYHRKVWPIMICSAEINSQGVSKYGCGGLCPDGYTPVHFPPSAIGETVFFTRAEAEAALAKMKGGVSHA